MPLIFLEGVISQQNETVIRELHGHVPYMNRQPNTTEGERGMTLLNEKGLVVAETFNDVYDEARRIHRLHVRRSNPG